MRAGAKTKEKKEAGVDCATGGSTGETAAAAGRPIPGGVQLDVCLGLWRHAVDHERLQDFPPGRIAGLRRPINVVLFQLTSRACTHQKTSVCRASRWCATLGPATMMVFLQLVTLDLR